MTSHMKNGTVPKKGAHPKKSKPATTKGPPPQWAAPFSNYAGDVPLPIDLICESLGKMTGGWPKCVSGVLC